MPDQPSRWQAIRVRAERHAQVTAAAKAQGVPVSVWADRALAAALGRIEDPAGQAGSVGGVSETVGPAPRRAPVIETVADVAREIERRPKRKPAPGVRDVMAERQAKLNADRERGKR